MLNHELAVFDGLGTDLLCFLCVCKMIGYWRCSSV